MSSKYMRARSPSHRRQMACNSLGKRLKLMTADANRKTCDWNSWNFHPAPRDPSVCGREVVAAGFEAEFDSFGLRNLQECQGLFTSSRAWKSGCTAVQHPALTEFRAVIDGSRVACALCHLAALHCQPTPLPVLLVELILCRTPPKTTLVLSTPTIPAL